MLNKNELNKIITIKYFVLICCDKSLNFMQNFLIIFIKSFSLS